MFGRLLFTLLLLFGLIITTYGVYALFNPEILVGFTSSCGFIVMLLMTGITAFCVGAAGLIAIE